MESGGKFNAEPNSERIFNTSIFINKYGVTRFYGPRCCVV